MSALDQWEARKLGVTEAAHADNTQCYITSQKPGPDHLIVTEFKKHFMFLCPRIWDNFVRILLQTIQYFQIKIPKLVKHFNNKNKWYQLKYRSLRLKTLLYYLKNLKHIRLATKFTLHSASVSWIVPPCWELRQPPTFLHKTLIMTFIRPNDIIALWSQAITYKHNS